MKDGNHRVIGTQKEVWRIMRCSKRKKRNKKQKSKFGHIFKHDNFSFFKFIFDYAGQTVDGLHEVSEKVLGVYPTK